MKNRIIVKKQNHDMLNFYLKTADKTFYLFSEHYSLSVHRYFYNGRLEDEVRSYKSWKNNFRLSKTISKIPMYIKYVLKESNYCKQNIA